MMDRHDKEPKLGEVIEIPVVKILPEFDSECDQAKIHFHRPETYIRYGKAELSLQCLVLRINEIQNLPRTKLNTNLQSMI